MCGAILGTFLFEDYVSTHPHGLTVVSTLAVLALMTVIAAVVRVGRRERGRAPGYSTDLLLLSGMATLSLGVALGAGVVGIVLYFAR